MSMLLVLMMFAGELGWVIHDAFPESLKSYTIWVATDFAKMPWSSLSDHLMTTRNNSGAAFTEHLGKPQLKNKTFSTVLGFMIGCFLLLEPGS